MMSLFDLLNGRVIIWADETLGLLVSWNRSLTFQVWRIQEDLQVSEVWACTASEEPLTLGHAIQGAEEVLRRMHQELGNEDE